MIGLGLTNSLSGISLLKSEPDKDNPINQHFPEKTKRIVDRSIYRWDSESASESLQNKDRLETKLFQVNSRPELRSVLDRVVDAFFTIN